MQFVDLHTHRLNSSIDVLSVLNCYPNSRIENHSFSIGIHPWYINTNTLSDAYKLLEEKLQLNHCVAVGECGLDKVITRDLEQQIIVFKHQVSLSEKHKKPMIIHCVRAHQEIIQLRKELKPKQPWIIHGFNKNIQVAKSLVQHHFMLSFGADLLSNEKLQKVFVDLPLSSIFLETDDSTINIKDVYKKAAEIKATALEQLKNNILENYKSIFKQ